MHTCSMYAVLPVDLLLILSISAKEPSPGALCLRLSSSEERQYREKTKTNGCWKENCQVSWVSALRIHRTRSWAISCTLIWQRGRARNGRNFCQKWQAELLCQEKTSKPRVPQVLVTHHSSLYSSWISCSCYFSVPWRKKGRVFCLSLKKLPCHLG